MSGLTCNPDYLNLLSNGCRDCLESVITIQRNDYVRIVVLASRIAHRHSLFLIEGRATSNASPDIMFGESEYYRKQQLFLTIKKNTFLYFNVSV